MGKLNFSNFGLQGVEQMSRAEMKGVVGGNMPPDYMCGIKIGGEWYAVSGGRAEAEGALGTNSTLHFADGGESVSGTVTNWRCDSCYWN